MANCEAMATLINNTVDKLQMTLRQLEPFMNYDYFKDKQYMNKLKSAGYREHLYALCEHGVNLTHYQVYAPLWMRERYLDMDIGSVAATRVVACLKRNLDVVHGLFCMFENHVKSNDTYVTWIASIDGLTLPFNKHRALEFFEEPAKFKEAQEFLVQLAILLNQDVSAA